MSGATRDGSRDHGAGGDRRVGGRFWALVESDEEEDADGGRHLAVGSPATASPTPSDHICEAFTSGYSEDEVALLVDEVIPQDDPARTGLEKTERIEIARRVVHRRTAATAIRPWRGPLPKVRLPALTFGDYLGSDWNVVPNRRQKKKRTATAAGRKLAAPAASFGIAAARKERLNFLLAADGPPVASGPHWLGMRPSSKRLRVKPNCDHLGRRVRLGRGGLGMRPSRTWVRLILRNGAHARVFRLRPFQRRALGFSIAARRPYARPALVGLVVSPLSELWGALEARPRLGGRLRPVGRVGLPVSRRRAKAMAGARSHRAKAMAGARCRLRSRVLVVVVCRYPSPQRVAGREDRMRRALLSGRRWGGRRHRRCRRVVVVDRAPVLGQWLLAFLRS